MWLSRGRKPDTRFLSCGLDWIQEKLYRIVKKLIEDFCEKEWLRYQFSYFYRMAGNVCHIFVILICIMCNSGERDWMPWLWPWDGRCVFFTEWITVLSDVRLRIEKSIPPNYSNHTEGTLIKTLNYWIIRLSKIWKMDTIRHRLTFLIFFDGEKRQ